MNQTPLFEGRFPFSSPQSDHYSPLSSVGHDVAPKIATAILSVPPNLAQGCVEGLEKFTQQQIEEMYQVLLRHPNVDFDQVDSLKIPFQVDEDVALLNYIRCEEPFDSFLAKFGFVFHPTRTKTMLEERIGHLKRLSQAEIDRIIEQAATQFAKEKRFSESLLQKKPQLGNGRPFHPSKEQCYCFKEFCPNLQKNKNLDSEIEAIAPAALTLMDNLFTKNDLAFLVNERIRYSMKNKFIIIGRQTDDNSMDNDVDLGFFNSLCCEHVSRIQATIQFMSDGKFYVENVGQNVFRINGAILYPKKVAEVPDQSIFDFNNTIFLFFINHKLVRSIMKSLNE